jgi:hypothetical protein
MTLSGVLASRVINSRLTLIVCPNDVVAQWATDEKVCIEAMFYDSIIITGKQAFDAV